MKIALLTDAPKHNLALMKLSTYHKKCGNEIIFNMPLWKADYTYASILFEKNIRKFKADEYGGPAVGNARLSQNIDWEKPDYNLYNLNHSLGYTWEYCPRHCPYCKVPTQKNPKIHRSIWSFHNAKFNKIELLNNNTFSDPQWHETFEEIWDANLILKEHGFDLRLLDDEKVNALKHTCFDGPIHYAWDRMKDENKILKAFKIAPKGTVYVLIGFETTIEEDLYRCQKIVDYGFDPYIMPYNQSDEEKRFKRFIDTFMWRKYKTLELAWKDYKK